MYANDSGRGDRRKIVAAIRHAVKRSGRGGTVSMRKFYSVSGIKWRHLHRHFPSWSEALAAAGIESKPGHRKIDPNRLLEDCGRVVRLLGRMPSRREYSAHGMFNETTLSKACRGWGNVSGALRSFAARRTKWSDLLKCFPSGGNESPRQRRRRMLPFVPLRTPAAIPCGAPLDFGILRHEPTNEQGVVFLFGMLAEKLGFVIEAFQSVFPDCQAKRLVRTPGSIARRALERWHTVRIEFEYESRNFRSHAHDPRGCDIIVCWNHNWPDCPVEVIALSEEIKRLATR